MKTKLLSLFVTLICTSSLFADFNIRLGDVTGDNIIDEADVDALGEYIVGRTPEGFVLEAADYNQDGKISVSDMAKMYEDIEKNKILELYSALEGNRYLEINNPTDPIFSLSTIEWDPSDTISPINCLNLTFRDTVYLAKNIPSCSNIEALCINGYNSKAIIGDLNPFLTQFPNLKVLRIHIPNYNKPFPETIRNLKRLVVIDLNYTNLIGTIPDWFYEMTQLWDVDLSETGLSGAILPQISQMSNLQRLCLNNNQFSGEILSYICNLPLIKLHLSTNGFTGTLPESFTSIMSRILQRDDIDLEHNHFGGTIPIAIREHPMWRIIWGRIIPLNNFSIPSAAIFPAPEYNLVDMNGQIHSSKDYSKHKLTIIYQWVVLNQQAIKMQEWYNKYNDKGLEIIGYYPATPDEAKNWINAYNIQWPVVASLEEQHDNSIDGYYDYPIGVAPIFVLIDSTGQMVYTSLHSENIIPDLIEINDIIEHYCDESVYYQSTDYSMDGRVDTLQLATEGNGINIVLMGDAFTDNQIANGEYREQMENVADAFFSEEPYRSFRHLFNVYIINVVSQTEGYQHSGQRLHSRIGDDNTYVYGNDSACINYALRIIPEDQIDNTCIMVLMDTICRAGTCNMYKPTNGNYGNGLSISYFTIESDSSQFNGLVSHEAGGHGFGKLADEYFYGNMGEISEEVINLLNRTLMSYHWYDNVDFTSDSSLVKWAHFLNDPRYNNQGLGCYEGGLTYELGVWRPTETSIMRYNTGGFNAPSREAIWYRIHKLAYGDSWQYNYEDFVSYDTKNWEQAVPQKAVKHSSIPADFVPLHAPVIKQQTWREALITPIQTSLQKVSRSIISHPSITRATKQKATRQKNVNYTYAVFGEDVELNNSMTEYGLPLNITALQQIKGLQFDIEIPDGVTADSGFYFNPKLQYEPTLSKYGILSDGRLRVLCVNNFDGEIHYFYDHWKNFLPMGNNPDIIVPLMINPPLETQYLIWIRNTEFFVNYNYYNHVAAQGQDNVICIYIKKMGVSINATAINGFVIGTGTYDYGTEVTLTAVPNDGYEFVNWSNGTTDNPYTFIAEQDVELIANFIKKVCTSWQDINSEIKVIKYFENERLIIERNGIKYTATGQKVK